MPESVARRDSTISPPEASERGLFSQVKYSVGGKLTSINYANARASVIVKSDCHADNSNNAYYRDEELYLH